MTISLLQTDRHRTRGNHWVYLLVAVYLLVVHYSLSHTHGEPVGCSPQAVALYESLSLDDHAEHWHSDQHHTSACKLVSQVSSSVVALYTRNQFKPVQNSLSGIASFQSSTPTKRMTRAPPVIV